MYANCSGLFVDSRLYLTLCDCSPSCFDPDLLLLAYLWLGLSWIGCISTVKHFPHQKQAAGTLHQQQAAGEAQQTHSVEITIKLSQGVGPYGTAHRQGAGPGTGAAAGALPADPHPACGHVQPPEPPGVAAPRRGRTSGRRGGTVVKTPQPVYRAGPLVPAPPPLPAPDGPGAPPVEPVAHSPGAPGRAELPAAGPPALPPGQSPEALQQGPLLDTATTVQQRGSSNADGAEPECTNC